MTPQSKYTLVILMKTLFLLILLSVFGLQNQVNGVKDDSLADETSHLTSRGARLSTTSTSVNGGAGAPRRCSWWRCWSWCGKASDVLSDVVAPTRARELEKSSSETPSVTQTRPSNTQASPATGSSSDIAYQSPVAPPTSSLAPSPNSRRREPPTVNTWNTFKMFFPANTEETYSPKLSTVISSLEEAASSSQLSTTKGFDLQDLRALLESEWQDYYALSTHPSSSDPLPFPDLLGDLLAIAEPSARFEEFKRRRDILLFAPQYWDLIKAHFPKNDEIRRQTQFEVKRLAVDGLAEPDPSSATTDTGDSVVQASFLVQYNPPPANGSASEPRADRETEIRLSRLKPWVYLQSLLGVYSPPMVIPEPFESPFAALLSVPAERRLERLESVFNKIFSEKSAGRLKDQQRLKSLQPPAPPARLYKKPKRTSTAIPSSHTSSSSTASGRRTPQSSPSPRASITRPRSGSTSSESASEEYGGSRRGWEKNPLDPLVGRDSDSEGSSNGSTGSRPRSRSSELTRLAPLISRMLREGIEISEIASPSPGEASSREKPGSKQSTLSYRRSRASDRQVPTSPHRAPGTLGSRTQENY